MEKVKISAKSTVKFKPHALHVMLVELKDLLKEGDEISIILNFSDTKSIDMGVPVKKDVMIESPK